MANNARYSFKHSIYLTEFTDWFLGFFGRGAQFILIITTLYQGASLLPGIALPQPINNAVFIVQMLTLDVGGMGLARIANQAREENDLNGANSAESLGKWLIRIVIATLVSAALEMIIHPLPLYKGDIKTYIDVTFVVISAALTIARAICAVKYTVVMHSLKNTAHTSTSQVPAIDLEKAVNDALAKQASEQAQVMEELKQQIEEVKTATQNTLPAVSETPDTEQIISTIMERLGEQFEVFLQSRVSVSPVFETPLISASHAHMGVSTQEVKTPRHSAVKTKTPVSKQVKHSTRNTETTIERHSRKVSDEEVDAAVHPLKSKDTSLTHRKIAQQIGIPETTVYRSLKRWRDMQPIVEGELAEEFETPDFETSESEEVETAI